MKIQKKFRVLKIRKTFIFIFEISIWVGAGENSKGGRYIPGPPPPPDFFLRPICCTILEKHWKRCQRQLILRVGLSICIIDVIKRPLVLRGRGSKMYFENENEVLHVEF